VFNGNSGRNDIVKHSLKEYASARFIRVLPTNFSTHKALRVEVYGILISAGIDYLTVTSLGYHFYTRLATGNKYALMK